MSKDEGAKPSTAYYPSPQAALSRLIGIAAAHARGSYFGKLTSNPDDMPSSIPKWVLREIANTEERYRKLAGELRDIADYLGPKLGRYPMSGEGL